MKKLAIITMLSLSTAITSCGSTYKPVEVQSVVNVPDVNKDTLFRKTRQWFSQYFVSGKSVVDYEDLESGTIIGNGIAKIGNDFMGVIEYNIQYNIRIDTKDGKFRALTKIIKHTNTDNTYGTYEVVNVSKKRIANAEAHVKKIVSDIESYVTDKKLSDTSDW